MTSSVRWKYSPEKINQKRGDSVIKPWAVDILNEKSYKEIYNESY
jgi:hypothetical protein